MWFSLWILGYGLQRFGEGCAKGEKTVKGIRKGYSGLAVQRMRFHVADDGVGYQSVAFLVGMHAVGTV